MGKKIGIFFVFAMACISASALLSYLIVRRAIGYYELYSDTFLENAGTGTPTSLGYKQ